MLAKRCALILVGQTEVPSMQSSIKTRTKTRLGAQIREIMRHYALNHCLWTPLRVDRCSSEAEIIVSYAVAHSGAFVYIFSVRRQNIEAQPYLRNQI